MKPKLDSLSLNLWAISWMICDPSGRLDFMDDEDFHSSSQDETATGLFGYHNPKAANCTPLYKLYHPKSRDAFRKYEPRRHRILTSPQPSVLSGPP